MGYLYKGDAILKGNLAVNTPKPLDARSIVQNATELLTIDSANAYTGMPIVSIDEAAIYILLDENNTSSLDSWKKIGNVIIDGNEIDLSSFVTTSELETQLNTLKTEIANNVDTKISISKTEILNEVDTKIDDALAEFTPGSGGEGSNITIDDVLTETSSNPVKSSGIYNGIKTMINAKFVVLTETEYKAMASHDANTFYYIKQ